MASLPQIWTLSGPCWKRFEKTHPGVLCTPGWVQRIEKNFFSPLNKFSELYRISENLGSQLRRTPFLGFPRTPFLSVAENSLLYRQPQIISCFSSNGKMIKRGPRSALSTFRGFATSGINGPAVQQSGSAVRFLIPEHRRHSAAGPAAWHPAGRISFRRIAETVRS